MREPSPLLLRVYRTALLLFPRRFRREYQQQILLTVLDAYRDKHDGSDRFWPQMFYDLLKAAATERVLMFREQLLRQPIFFHAATLGLILTVLGGTATVIVQQMLRRGANQPQAEMAEVYASEIKSGTDPRDVIPAGHVDLERNLEPFVIFYDIHGKPEKSTGYLDQYIPALPPGIFEYLRSHGDDTVTWQPRPGVRIAAVAKRVSGPHPGYLLAGRSLRLTEEYESLLRSMSFVGWFAIMLLLLFGAILLSRAERAKRIAA